MKRSDYTILFSRTIKENISIVKPNTSMDEVKKAASIARVNIKPWIKLGRFFKPYTRKLVGLISFMFITALMTAMWVKAEIGFLPAKNSLFP